MNMWESLVVIAIFLVVGAKLYTAWKGKRGQASASQPANFAGSTSIAIEPSDTDPDPSEGNPKSTDAWDDKYMIVMALVLCAPLGLILLWKTDKLDSNTKAKLIVGYIAIVLLLAALKLNAT